jgi:hypothetical protein
MNQIETKIWKMIDEMKIDWKSKDDAGYWHPLFKKISKETVDKRIIRPLIKRIKKIKGEHRFEGKSWEERFSEDELRFIDAYFYEKTKSGLFDCMDGKRAAHVGISSEVRRFKKLRTCCGSLEEVLEYRKYVFFGPVVKILVGFNYGH